MALTMPPTERANEAVPRCQPISAMIGFRNTPKVKASTGPLQTHRPVTAPPTTHHGLMNLMLNGIEAMKDAPGDLVITSQCTDDGHLLISVSDSGIGIPPEQAERIFEAFVTTKPRGIGMGLSISRTIVESHGGRVWASANTTRGATFQFTLPVEVGSPSPTAV